MEFLDVYHKYKPELLLVERVLQDTVQSNQTLLTQSSTQLLEAGGKRIRPLFALLCGALGSGVREPIYNLAAAMEIVHMATLVHDDVIDDAAMRRGVPTVRSQFGNRPAMYTGDYLFSRAIQLLVTVNQPQVHVLLSDAITKMVEGEIDQIREFYNIHQTMRTYFRRIKRKTALLIQMSCLLGAMVGGASEEAARAVGKFGYFTGMAFQVIDDVLDIVGNESVVGKRVGGDLRQGNITLPVLWTLRNTDEGQALATHIQPNMSDEVVDSILEVVRSSPALDVAYGVASMYMQKAVESLHPIQSSDVYEPLLVIAEFINQRAF